jgi:hypothetical protein
MFAKNASNMNLQSSFWRELGRPMITSNSIRIATIDTPLMELPLYDLRGHGVE